MTGLEGTPDAPDASETIRLIGHHSGETEILPRQLVNAFRDGLINDILKRPLTRAEEDGLIGRWARWHSVRFYFPRPARGPTLGAAGTVEIVIGRTGSKYNFRGEKVVEIPLFAKEVGCWYEAAAGRINALDPYETNWVLKKFLQTVPIYQPDFAFGGLGSDALTRVKDNPRQRAWPLMILGPHLVTEWGGRKKVLESPAFRVDELDGGRVLIQAAENPFVAPEDPLANLAAHLGLGETFG